MMDQGKYCPWNAQQCEHPTRVQLDLLGPHGLGLVKTKKYKLGPDSDRVLSHWMAGLYDIVHCTEKIGRIYCMCGDTDGRDFDLVITANNIEAVG